jgi:hypothetical protein
MTAAFFDFEKDTGLHQEKNRFCLHFPFGHLESDYSLVI